jgi:Na+-transporting methylmalonyl-CoA/oxaloacetate decarboxylase gamma subunit
MPARRKDNMLWAISAVTTPLALIIYLCTNDCADLLPLNYGVVRKFLLYAINTLPLLFVAFAFLLDTHVLMICGLAIIIFFYIILYATRSVSYVTAALWQRRQASKNLAHNAEHMVVGALIVLMLLSAINTVVIMW